jgi:biotin synthase
VPVKFLIPFEGTPLASRWELTAERSLRILALCRLGFPDIELRLADRRENHLRGLQVLALHIANSILLGEYLTARANPGRTTSS